MGSVTTSKGLPYSLGTDFADPRAIRDLANAADVAFAGYDTAFTAGPRPHSFLIRQTADSGTGSSGSTILITGNGAAVDWNTSGGTVSGTGVWTQPTTEVPSWWMFGVDLVSVPVSGTITVGSRLQAIIAVNSFDVVTGQPALSALGDGASSYAQGFSNVNFATEGVETNTSGDWIGGTIIVPIYKATVSALLVFSDPGAAAVKKAGTGGVLWGVKLGEV